MLISAVCRTYSERETVGRLEHLVRIDQLLSDLVEVRNDSLDRPPLRLPAAQVLLVLVRLADHLGEVVVDEQLLGEVIEGFESGLEPGTVPVSNEEPAAQPVDRANEQVRQIT